jgi:hypothetical protein
VEAQKKIEAAIRQVGITFLRIANVAYGNISFLSYIIAHW